MISNLDCVDLSAKYFIYKLSCPITNIPKYIGMTKKPKERYRKHLNEKSLTLKNTWVKSLLNKGLKPVMQLVDFSNSLEEINIKEKYWIIKYREWGFDLKNMTDGGDGGDTFSGRKHKQSSKEKISLANSGNKRPDLAIENKKRLSRKVAQIDFITKEIINIFPSVIEAHKQTKCSKTNISRFANGTIKPSIKKVGGYEWKYID